VVAPVVEGVADFVSGSRRLGTTLTTDGFRQAGVVLFGLLISVLTGSGSPTRRAGCGHAGRGHCRGDAPSAAVSSRRADDRHRPGWLPLAEVPITMRPRSAGVTKKGGNLLYGARFAGWC